MDKQSLRREILSIRDRLGKEEKGRMDEALHHKLLSLELALGGPPVYLYLSFGSEIDTWGILKELTSRNIPVAAPRVRGKEMAFFKIRGPEDLKPGFRGIMEPVPSFPLMEPEGEELFIVPGAVFDREGYRIGYGGGYYDRYLAARREIPFHTLALAYPFQLVEKIPRDDWDLPVGRVLTPQDI